MATQSEARQVRIAGDHLREINEIAENGRSRPEAARLIYDRAKKVDSYEDRVAELERENERLRGRVKAENKDVVVAVAALGAMIAVLEVIPAASLTLGTLLVGYAAYRWVRD